PGSGALKRHELPFCSSRSRVTSAMRAGAGAAVFVRGICGPPVLGMGGAPIGRRPISDGAIASGTSAVCAGCSLRGLHLRGAHEPELPWLDSPEEGHEGGDDEDDE